MFAEVARAIRRGIGFTFEARAILMTTGVMKMQIVSFTKRAERKAEVTIMNKSILTSVLEKKDFHCKIIEKACNAKISC